MCQLKSLLCALKEGSGLKNAIVHNEEVKLLEDWGSRATRAPIFGPKIRL